MTAAATSPDRVPAPADSFDFKAYLTKAKATVEQALDAALLPERPESLREAMRYSLLAGGKRFWPPANWPVGRRSLPFPPRWLWR
jgi:geranylgeranyl diphosphate synthase type II